MTNHFVRVYSITELDSGARHVQDAFTASVSVDAWCCSGRPGTMCCGFEVRENDPNDGVATIPMRTSSGHHRVAYVLSSAVAD